MGSDLSQLPSFTQLFWILAGGILPTLLWLWLWLKEDLHPEPRKRIIIAFIGGMVMVPLAGLIEYVIWPSIANPPTHIIILWAAVEELLKFGAALFTSLTKKDDDEAADPIIYMITTALGFAALENVFYLFNPVQAGGLINSIDTENLRFIGANLIHVVSSGAIGVSLGLAFCKNRFSKVIHFLFGFAIAVSLHSLFNLFIINSNGDIGSTLSVFFAVWILIVMLALFFEKVKTVVCEIQPLANEQASERKRTQEAKRLSIELATGNAVERDGGTYRIK